MIVNDVKYTLEYLEIYTKLGSAGESVKKSEEEIREILEWNLDDLNVKRLRFVDLNKLNWTPTYFC